MSNHNDNYYEDYKKSLESKGNIAESNNNVSSANYIWMPLGLLALGVAGYLGYTMYPSPEITPFQNQNTKQKILVESIKIEKKALATLSEKVVTRDKSEVVEPFVVQNTNTALVELSSKKEINTKDIDEKKKQIADVMPKEKISKKEVIEKGKPYSIEKKEFQENKNDKEPSDTHITPIKKEIATNVNKMRIIVVKKGDTLGSLALKAYGNVMDYPKIIAANSDTLGDSKKLFVGQKIKIP
ncbi:MAG: LysM peptidoglycan-binding domain-containing protein [Campylobacterota bacterium]|nr:LysM peptidoglycan-binding domain-containing protein [Campylobacterota bacterium]